MLDIVKEDFNLCVFDFSGYGYSQGEFSTLGIKEDDDLECVLSYLRQEKKYTHLFLWGRSMGAVTIVLALSRLGNEVACDGVVLDAPFTSTRSMVGCGYFAAVQRYFGSAQLLARFSIRAAREPAEEADREGRYGN